LAKLVEQEAKDASAALQQPFVQADYVLARPLNVLARLHAHLAESISGDGRAVFTKRVELGALKKNWSAWRAARTS
jgi:hypothetical protein